MSDPITEAANERQAALDKLVGDLVEADKNDSTELLATRAKDSVLDDVRPWSDFAEQQDMAVNKNDDDIRPWSDFAAQEDMAATTNEEDPVLGELRSWNDFASEKDLAVDARELSADARLRFNRRGLESDDTNRRRSLEADDANRRRSLEADDANRRRSLEADAANRRRSLEADEMQRRRRHLADETQRGRGRGHLADESLGHRHHHLQAQDFMAAGNERALGGASGDMPQMFGGAFILVAAIALFAGFVRRRKQATAPPKPAEFDYQLYM